MKVYDARSLFIQELHTYLVAHFSNTPKLAITMDCTGRIADVVLYIHCTNDQWYVVAIDIVKMMQADELRKAFVMTTLSEEEKLPQSYITYYSLDIEAMCNFNPFIESLQKHIF